MSVIFAQRTDCLLGHGLPLRRGECMGPQTPSPSRTFLDEQRRLQNCVDIWASPYAPGRSFGLPSVGSLSHDVDMLKGRRRCDDGVGASLAGT